jgi:integrase
MAEVFKRKGTDKWQCYVWEPGPGGKFKRRPVSTRIVDDGSKKSRQNAEAVARNLQGQSAGGRDVAKQEVTCKQALKKLTSRLELAGRRFATIRSVIYRGANVVSFFGEKRAISTIDDDAIMEYAKHARQTREPITVSEELDVLRRMMLEAGLKPGKLPEVGDTTPKPQKVLTPEQAQVLWLRMPNKRKITTQAYLQLGLRRSEPWKISAINFSTGWAEVAGTKTKGSVRDVPVPDELLAELYRYKADFRQAFPPWNLDTVSATLTSVARRVGIVSVNEYLTVNDTRGTYASHQAMNGIPIVKLASYMGTSIKMLEKYYVQLQTDERSRKEAETGAIRFRPGAALDMERVRAGESDAESTVDSIH